MKRALSSVIAVVVLAWTTVAAAAPMRSVAAATASLPSDVEAFVGTNVKTVRSMQLFAKLFPELLRSERDLEEGLGKVKKTCGIDPVTAVDDVTIGVDPKERGGIFIALTGVTEQKVVDCITKIAKAEGEREVTSKKTGNITELRNDKKSESIFFAWLPGDVLVMATDPMDKAALERALGGKGALAKSSLGARLAKAPQEAAVVAAWTKTVKEQGVTVREGTVALGYQGGVVSFVALVELGSADEAEKVASLAKLAPAALGSLKGAPKELDKLVRSLDAKATGSEVRVTAQAPESDLLTIAKWAMQQAGGGGSTGSAPKGAPLQKAR